MGQTITMQHPDEEQQEYIFGGGGGSSETSYNNLTNKPQINGVTLSGDKSSDDFNLQTKLIAGDNVQIINNVISATGGGSSVTLPDDIPISHGLKIKEWVTTGNKTLEVDTDVIQEKLIKGEGIDISGNRISVVPAEWIKVYSGSAITNYNINNSILVGMLARGDEGWVLDRYANDEIRVTAQGENLPSQYRGDVYSVTYNMVDIYDAMKDDILSAMPERLSDRIYPFHFVSMIEYNRNENVHVEFKFIIVWQDDDRIELRIVPVVNKTFLPAVAPITGTARTLMARLTIFVR